MPQAPQWLRDKFPKGDGQASEILGANFIISQDGVIRPKVHGYDPTPEEDLAIDYLVYEWDYGYEPLGDVT